MGKTKQKKKSRSVDNVGSVQEKKSAMKGGDANEFQGKHGEYKEIPMDLIEANPWNP